jgi:hypothetical protein
MGIGRPGSDGYIKPSILDQVLRIWSEAFAVAGRTACGADETAFAAVLVVPRRIDTKLPADFEIALAVAADARVTVATRRLAPPVTLRIAELRRAADALLGTGAAI